LEGAVSDVYASGGTKTVGDSWFYDYEYEYYYRLGCHAVKSGKDYGEACCSHLQGRRMSASSLVIEASSFAETSVTFN
jgi:hypothetical protein